jgi:hypothetical protein
MPLLSLRRRLSGEGGFTMATVMVALLVLMLATVAAHSAVQGDQRQSRHSHDQKRAYAAAQAGLDWYLSQLRNDPNYWALCTTVPQIGGQPAPVSDPYWGTGTDNRAWRTIPGTNQQYNVELLPSVGGGQAACNPADPAASMIDNATGTLRIRANGRAGGARRSIVATLRRRGFLDYMYLTDLETRAPLLYGTAQEQTDAATECSIHYWKGRASWCTTIRFADADSVAGPFHTNDSIYTCGSPAFGRLDGSGQPIGDLLEISAPATDDPATSGIDERAVRGCGGSSPVWNGTLTTSAPELGLPPDNQALSAGATPGYVFEGKTWITLNASGDPAGTMRVTNTTMGLLNQQMTQPSNGVIYVENAASCASSYDVLNPYGDDEGCGDAFVRGVYTRSMTIGARKDVVITDDITRSGDALLGLVANGFVRIYHKVSPLPPSTGSCGGADNVTQNWAAGEPGSNANLTIEAAILALTNSFVVDNWWCGNGLQNLTVRGAIAQKYRGPVGTGSGSTGYVKVYEYDDRLRYRSPPRFLNPVRTGWMAIRLTEQVGAL